MKTKKLKKLRKLNRKANYIIGRTNLNWDEKYGKIFSAKISTKVYKLIHFDYYDPDTSYEEDVCAFVNAFNWYMTENKLD